MAQDTHLSPRSDADGIDHEKAQRATRMLLKALGEDPDRNGLEDTWKRRVPDAFTTLTDGNRSSEKPTMRTFGAESDGLVIKTGIPFHSLCEHHLLPFHGTVDIAYRPDGEVVGLSKLTRYVRWQSRQLTMQERLTNDIAAGLADELDAEAVCVEMNATHLCESMRGIETESTTTTQSTIGELTGGERERFRTSVMRSEGRP